MNVISRGIRNAFRNVIRTFSIVIILGLSVGLSLSMLVAHQAVGQKIASVEGSVDNTISIAPAGERGFEGGGNPLTMTQLAKVKALPHVTALSESLSDRLTTSETNLQSAVSLGTLGQRFAQNSGESFTRPTDGGSSVGGGGSTGGIATFVATITVNGTTDPSDLSTTEGGGTFKLTSGKVFSSDSTANVAVLGTTIASKNNLKVGSTFTAYSTTITVVGIYDAGNTFSNNQVIMPLATVQKLSSQTGDVTSATATIDSVDNVTAATTAIQKSLGNSTADVTNLAQEAQTTVAPLKSIQTISLYSVIGAVIAGAVIILLTMIMIVRERRREIGVIKAIGASNIRVMLQFMVEAVTLTVLGSVIGIILGVVAGNPITKLLVNNSSSSTTTTSTIGGGGFSRGAGRAFGGLHTSIDSVHAVIGWSIIIYGLGAAILIALIGSALASFFIAKIRPAEVMRVE